MNGYTYDQVKTVLESREDQDMAVKCVFTCPKTGFTVESIGAIPIDQEKMQADAMKQGYMMAGKSFLLSNILNVVGLGRYAGTVSQLLGKFRGGGENPISFKFSEEDKQQAVVNAFSTVSFNFEWDEAAGTFIAKEQPDTGATTEV